MDTGLEQQDRLLSSTSSQPKDLEQQSLNQLHSLITLGKNWFDATTNCSTCVKYFSLSNFDDAEISTVNPITLKFTIVIDASHKLYLYIGSQLSSFTALPPADLSNAANAVHLEEFLEVHTSIIPNISHRQLKIHQVMQILVMTPLLKGQIVQSKENSK